MKIEGAAQVNLGQPLFIFKPLFCILNRDLLVQSSKITSLFRSYRI